MPRPSDLPFWHTIDGWLSAAEADTLYDLAAVLPAWAAVVEIGTYRGRATAALALGCAESGAALTTIDHYQGVVGAAADWSSSPARVQTTLALLPLPPAMHPRVTYLAVASVQAAATWPGTPVHLLVVDGSHDEASVTADLTAWWPYLAPGATVAVHDYCAGHGDGVLRAVDACVAAGRTRLVRCVDLLACLEVLA